MPEQDNEKSTQGTDHRPGPLDRLLIADFSRVLAGPYGTMLLGDLGATVIKVESPAGDETRTWLPPDRNGVATYYLAINRNKRSITLDFNDPADLRLAQELAARADVFIENFKPGSLKRFCLDYDTVRQQNAALNHRSRTGEGQHVEVSLLASALSGMVNQTSAYVAGGVIPTRMGNAHPSLFPYEPLPTADQDLVIAVGNNGQFSKLCEILDLPELPYDPRFANTEDRTNNREALRPRLVERLRTRTASEWFQRLSAAGVPCGPINSIDGGVKLACDLGLDPVVDVGCGNDIVPMIRHPIAFSLTPPRHTLPPPALGQDNEQIRAWLSQTPRIDPEDLKAARTSAG